MRRVLGFGLGVLSVLVIGAAPAGAGQAPAAAPTFTKDIAPILFNNCAVCHRAGEIAPMSLLSYEDARPWAKAIKEKVVSREMPPWYADDSGVKLRNDRRLSQQQIDTIAKWVDAGSPKGNEADLPPAPSFASGWAYGKEPDAIVEMPIEYEIPAEGEVDNLQFYTKLPFTEDKFAIATEARPGNTAVVHHASLHVRDFPKNATLVNGQAVGPDGLPAGRGRSRNEDVVDNTELEDGDKLVSYVPGRGLEVHRENAAKRVPANKWLSFGQHYQPTGKIEKDRTRLGLWFAKGAVKYEILTGRIGSPLNSDYYQQPSKLPDAANRYIIEGKVHEDNVIFENGRRVVKRNPLPNIPPYADNWAITGISAVTEDITVYAVSPHMHLRGKDMKYLVTFPDGREQVIANIPKYDFNWQLNYELETPMKIPAGSVIKTVGHYDNSLKNKYNPGPDQEVYWSEQSWDEMYNGFMEYSVDSKDFTKTSPNTQQQQQQ